MAATKNNNGSFARRSKASRLEAASKGGRSTAARGHNKNQWTPAEARRWGRIAVAMRGLGMK